MSSDASVTNPRYLALTSLQSLVTSKNQELGFSFSSAYMTNEPPLAAAFLAEPSSIDAEDTWTGNLASQQAYDTRMEVDTLTGVFADLEAQIETAIANTPEDVPADSEEAQWPHG